MFLPCEAQTTRGEAYRHKQHPLYICCGVAAFRREMGFSLGHLPADDRCTDPLVLYCQLAGCGVLPLGYPHHDHDQDSAARHCQVGDGSFRFTVCWTEPLKI